MKLIIVMPAFNEGEGITSFVDEISINLQDHELSFFIVNDASMDDTEEKLKELSLKYRNLEWICNEKNLGHGRSTIKALKFASNSTADIVISVDGDGQFIGEDFANLVQFHTAEKCEVTEGVRKFRNEASFRKIVTFCVRIIIFAKSRKLPRDGNTPLRVYSKSSLIELLKNVPENSAVPNIHISILVRKASIRFRQLSVTSRPRRGLASVGTTWQSKRKRVPSRRFLQFCASSVKELFISRN